MKTSIEQLEDNKVSITVEVSAKEISDRFSKTYKDYAHKYTFPGFRKGKAPRPVIDNAFGAESIAAIVTDKLVNEFYPLAIDQEDIEEKGNPEFEENLEPAENGKDYTFTFKIGVAPQFELDNYGPVEVQLPPAEVTEEEVEAQMEDLAEYYVTYEETDEKTIGLGSQITANIRTVGDDGAACDSLTRNGFVYTLGNQNLLPFEFDLQMTGMAAGDKTHIDLDIDEESGTLLIDLAKNSKQAHIDIEIITVKQRQTPEVTDEWVNETLGYENLEELRERMRETLAHQKSEYIPRMKENQCLAQIAERLVGEIDESMIEDTESKILQDFFRQLQAQGMTFDMYLESNGLTSDQFKADIKEQAKDEVKRDLALDAWARNAKFQVSDEEISQEFIDAGLEDPAAVEKEWREAGRIHLIRHAILRMKALTEIKLTAVVRPLDLLAETAVDAEESEEAAEEPEAKEAE